MMDMLIRGAGQFFRRLFVPKAAISMQFPGRGHWVDCPAISLARFPDTHKKGGAVAP
jgi:hypothetical protein